MALEERTITLLKKELLTENIYILRFSKPDGFEYDAGQFVQFLIPVEGGTRPRSYSISSAPNDDFLEFCVKYIEDGLASEYFKALPTGETSQIRGPLGRFVCEQKCEACVFIATGAGIAPVMGMIKDQLMIKCTDHNIFLLFGVRHESDVFWADRFEELSKEYKNFSYNITLSKPVDTWHGQSGRVTAHLDEYDNGCDFFICGTPPMVKDVKKHLEQRGVEKKRMHFEIF